MTREQVSQSSPRPRGLLAVLGELGADVPNPGLLVLIERDEQVRVRWEGTPIDLFFAYDALHRSSMERRRRVDFYGDPIHVLSAEDLIVYKATFDRSKDWDDIAGMIFASPAPSTSTTCATGSSGSTRPSAGG